MMPSRRVLVVTAIFALAAQACNLAARSSAATEDLTAAPATAQKPTVVITSPQDKTRIGEGTLVIVASVSTDPKGLQHVDLIVDGKVASSDKLPNAPQSMTLTQEWEPETTAPGKHTVSIVAYNVDNLASDPAAISIEFTRDFSHPFRVTSYGMGALTGAYTKAEPCGEALRGCTTEDHSLVPVKVENGTDAQGVDITDWYAPGGSFPAFGSGPGPIPAPAASSSPRTIAGSVIYPASENPPTFIVAFRVSGFPNQYYASFTKPGERSYKIQVPDGEYYLVAYAFDKASFIAAQPVPPAYFTPIKTCPPVTGAPAGTNHISIALTWAEGGTSPVNKARAFIVKYGNDSVQLPADARSFTIEQDLPAGASLDVQVIAHNDAGDAPSEKQTFTCP